MLFYVRYKIPQGFYNKASLKWIGTNSEILSASANVNTDANCSDRPLRAAFTNLPLFLCCQASVSQLSPDNATDSYWKPVQE